MSNPRFHAVGVRSFMTALCRFTTASRRNCNKTLNPSTSQQTLSNLIAVGLRSFVTASRRKCSKTLKPGTSQPKTAKPSPPERPEKALSHPNTEKLKFHFSSFVFCRWFLTAFGIQFLKDRQKTTPTDNPGRKCYKNRLGLPPWSKLH